MRQLAGRVLMDIHLTGMTGIECARRVKALKPELQILMLTVYEDSEQIFTALTAGPALSAETAAAGEVTEAIREVHDGARRCPIRSRAKW